MNFFGRAKPKTAADTVKSLKDHIVRLDQTTSPESKRRVSPSNNLATRSSGGGLTVCADDGLM